jgi:DNA-binding transcriptional MocR family regulator
MALLAESAQQSSRTRGDARYRRLADFFADAIRHGSLRVGQRLPSVRRLVESRGVSVTTALAAYRLLETGGWIDARPRSGYFVRFRQRRLPPPAMPPPVAPAARAVRAGDLVGRVLSMHGRPGVIPLGAAAPVPELLPFAVLSQMAARIARAQPRRCGNCMLAPGDEFLRQQVAARLTDTGCTLGAESLLITLGSTEALSLSLAATVSRGDAIVVESPAYYGVLQLIECQGLLAVEVPADPSHGVDPDDIARAAVKTRAAAVLLTPNYHNPLGCVLSDERKEALALWAARTGIPLIEDDTYGELAHEGPRPTTLKSFDKEGWVLLCGSFSKTLAPGYRTGWCAPGRFTETVRRMKLFNTIGNPSLPQLVISQFLARGGFDRHLRRLRQVYRQNTQLFADQIFEHFPPGTKLCVPTGGQLLWTELPRGYNAVRLFEHAERANIGIAPGRIFTTRRAFQRHLRVNIGVVWDDRIARAIAMLGTLCASSRE